MFKSLRLRFVAIIAPIYVVTVMVGLGAYEWITYSESRTALVERLDRVASSQSIILSEAVATQNVSNLSLMLASIISDRDLVGVAVFDRDGGILDTYGELSGDPELVRQLTINHADEDGFRRVGTLRLVMTDDVLMAQAFDRLVLGSVFALLLFVAVMAGAVVAYNRIIAKPISQLLSAFRKPGIDDVRTIVWESDDEMGELCAAFNEMICRLDLYRERLRDEQGELERRVEERTRELADAMNRAEAASIAKTRFMSSMSHELRTPLNAILGFGQLLQFDSENKLTKLQHAHIQDILKSGNHLMTLISEILDFTRIEEGDITIEMEAVPLAEMIEECVSYMAPLAATRSTRIHNETADKSICARGDYARLKQAVTHLLSNAIKYSKDGSDVWVQIATPDADTVRIRVKDTGPGIPSEKQADLFEPFSRLGAENTGVEGSGIGLTITKRIVELMNGHVGFESTPGVGSTFWIDVAMAETELQSGISNAPAGSGSNKTSDACDSRHVRPALKVLYVEDHNTNARLLARIIDHVEDTTMIHSETAEDGLLHAIEDIPDLIITDINLPEMSGFDLFDEIQKHERLKHVPVVALSADGSSETIQRARDAGFERYLTKPMNIPEIVSVLEHYRAQKTREPGKTAAKSQSIDH